MTPSTELRNGSTDKPIDVLFKRLSALYGKHWADLWDGVPMADVKDAWQTELSGVRWSAVNAAIAQLGKFPPTLPEFVALCKVPSVPAAHRPLLPDKRKREPIPPHVKAQLDNFMRKVSAT